MLTESASISNKIKKLSIIGTNCSCVSAPTKCDIKNTTGISCMRSYKQKLILLLVFYTCLPHEPQSSWSQSGGSHDSTVWAIARQRKSKKKLPRRAIRSIPFYVVALARTSACIRVQVNEGGADVNTIT